MLFVIVCNLVKSLNLLMFVYFDNIDVILERVFRGLVWVIDFGVAVNSLIQILCIFCILPFIWITLILKVIQILKNGPFYNLLFFMSTFDHT